METRVVHKKGGSLAVTLPKEYIGKLGLNLQDGDVVKVDYKNKKIIITK